LDFEYAASVEAVAELSDDTDTTVELEEAAASDETAEFRAGAEEVFHFA